MPHKEGFKLLATLVGASLVSPSAKIEKLPHPEKVIVITNDVKSLAKSAAVAVKRGAQVMTGANLMDSVKDCLVSADDHRMVCNMILYYGSLIINC